MAKLISLCPVTHTHKLITLFINESVKNTL
jgi:hypothetical protein